MREKNLVHLKARLASPLRNLEGENQSYPDRQTIAYGK
jgi:hypothetical protein